MDVKSLISLNSTDFVETPSSLLKGLFNDNSASFGVSHAKQDALEAVKLDPAVLEAQVTLHSIDNAIDISGFTGRAEVIDNNRETVPMPPAPTLEPTPSQSPNGFEDMVLQHEAALLSLTHQQMEMLMKYTDVLRRQRMITQRYLECAFCKKNGKPSSWYTTHALRDARGRVRCPVLRAFRCPRCGATGDQAHTIKYCPDSPADSLSSSGKSSL